MSSVFTKIINREIPANIIYEDENFISFLDIHPISLGHVLVIPKFKNNSEIDYLFDMDDEEYNSLMLKSKMIAKKLKEKLNCKRLCVIVEGYAVAHVHVHLIPTNHEDDLKKENRNFAPDKNYFKEYEEKLKMN